MSSRAVLLIALAAVLAVPALGAAKPRAHAPPAPKASGLDDGKAGMAALDRGAYDEAARLFTAALNSGDLAGDDEELAYLNRAKAFGGKGDYSRAILDLKRAVTLKPDDAEAEADLQLAVAQKLQVAGVQPGQEHPESAWKAFGKALLTDTVAGIAQRLQDANAQQQPQQ